MIIHFKRKDDKFVTEAGVEVDRGLIATFPHKYNADGSGHVTVPDCIYGEGVNVKFVGTKVEKPMPPTAPYVSYPGITPEREGQPTTKSNTTLKQIGAIQGDIPGKIHKERAQEQAYKNGMERFMTEEEVAQGLAKAVVVPATEPEELKDLGELKDTVFNGVAKELPMADADFILSEDYTTYYNMEVMKSLGFQDRELARWWHPVFGDDKEWNWLYFDPYTDSLQSIVVKAFKTGRVQGQRGIRNDIKAALDIR